MHTKPFFPGILCCCFFIALTALPARAGGKYFCASREHFRDEARKAAAFYFKAESAAEKHILSHLTSVASIYAEKTNTVANLVDIKEHMTANRDRLYVQGRLAEFRHQNALSLPQDIKLLTDLVEAQQNQVIHTLGNRIINEMRVFERNVENL